MLVRFSVRNYRSFRDEQVLSLEAGRQGVGKRGRSFTSGMKGAPNLLHGAVIYGANSGGKSNLISALAFMKNCVAKSAQGQRNDLLNVEPYRLDKLYLDQPSQFELVFIVDNSLYQYGFAADENMVHAEWLYETPAEGRIRHLFNRDINNSKTGYDWYINPRIKGERRLWQEATRPNALFISTSIQLNSTEFSKPFDWITKKLQVIAGSTTFGQAYTSHVCHKHDTKSSVLSILQAVDPGIVDVIATEGDFSETGLPEDLPEDIRDRILKEMKGKKVYEVEIARRSRDGLLVKFDLEDESTGTNILFSLSGPWLDTLEKGYTLVIDELDSGLHPLALKTLVAMFFEPAQNTSNAQLVITCHEATLLRENLLRTDQVWFIDRTTDEGSRLYPLSEFRPRENESFLRGYLGGRYGGVPLTRSLI